MNDDHDHRLRADLKKVVAAQHEAAKLVLGLWQRKVDPAGPGFTAAMAVLAQTTAELDAWLRRGAESAGPQIVAAFKEQWTKQNV